jgi:hypothetical protein
MQNTEMIYQAKEGLSHIINQINSCLTIDADIIKMSQHIDSLLDKLISEMEESN